MTAQFAFRLRSSWSLRTNFHNNIYSFLLIIILKFHYRLKLNSGVESIKKVYKEAIAPCSSFPKTYGLIESVFLKIMFSTCKVTEIPPNPSIKAEMMRFVEIFFANQVVFKRS